MRDKYEKEIDRIKESFIDEKRKLKREFDDIREK